jgi:hypothetical protein
MTALPGYIALDIEECLKGFKAPVKFMKLAPFLKIGLYLVFNKLN